MFLVGNQCRVLENVNLKILLLTFYFPPDLCAGSFRAGATVDALLENIPDIRIDVITTLPNRYSTYSTNAAKREDLRRCSIYRVELPKHKSGMVDQAKAFYKYLKSVLKLTKNKDYDLVYATSSRLMTAVLGAYVANRAKTILYLDIRDIFTDTMNEILSKKVSFFLHPIFAILERWTIMKASHVNLVSEGFKDYFSARYSKPSYSYFTNGIDDTFIVDDHNHPPNNSTVKTILYAGNIGEGQGLHNIVPQLAQKTAEFANFRIIGDGGRKPQLAKALAKLKIKNVELIDPVTRDDLLNEYRKADILFLHLNNFRAFEKVLPSKIFEYAAVGKPILAGVAGYSAYFLKSEVENSAVFEPCNLKQAFDAVSKLKFHRAERRDFIRKFSRTKIMNEMAHQIFSVYNIKLSK